MKTLNITILAAVAATAAVSGLHAQTTGTGSTAPRYAQLDAPNTFTNADGLIVRGSGPNLETGQPFCGTTTVSLGVGPGTRMQFIPGYSAFRAGTVDGVQWDQAKLGLFSTAFGYNTIASGPLSYASGMGTDAGGFLSVAMGYNTKASGDLSFALGYASTASGEGGFAFGSNAVASGGGSMALGGYTTASGSMSTALGMRTTASGIAATALGNNTVASGVASTAMGNVTTASGRFSSALGYGTVARSFGETAVGLFNVDAAALSTSAWNGGDRLFVVGNGQSATARSDALVVFKNGNAMLKGTLTQGSDRNRKTDIALSDTRSILALVGELPLYTWKYRGEDVTHLGPMAQDFFAAFQLGGTDTGIASVDADGVALAAIQELKKHLDAKSAEIARLHEQARAQADLNRDLLARLAALERKLDAQP